MPNNPDNWTRAEMFALWALLGLSALTGLCARVAQRLFSVSEMPPEDATQFAAWKLRRRWMVFSEFSALPAFATGWMAAGMYWSLPVPFLVLGSMATGALGVGWTLDALQNWAAKRVNNA